jgi:fructose-bisphosphate aldolase, class II
VAAPRCTARRSTTTRETFSTPENARAFVAATGIDTLAAAVGNLHGRYPVPKQLDLALLRRIRDAIDVNISLHGGSGTPGDYFQAAARIGVGKINVNSDLRYAYRSTLESQLREHPDEYAVVKLIGPVIRAVQDVVESRIDVFGASGKARP